MRRIILFLSLLLLFASETLCQENDLKAFNRYGIGFLPSNAQNIYGLALGLIGSEVRCDLKYTKKTHGVNLQVFGQGFFSPFYIFDKRLSFYDINESFINYDDSLNLMRTKHNGILIAGFGTFTEHVNGISISPWMSVNHKVNGFSLNILSNCSHTINGLSLALYNVSYEINGLQVGLVNRTRKLKGFQIGLWNVNEKRKLPFINWSFY